MRPHTASQRHRQTKYSEEYATGLPMKKALRGDPKRLGLFSGCQDQLLGQVAVNRLFGQPLRLRLILIGTRNPPADCWFLVERLYILAGDW